MLQQMVLFTFLVPWTAIASLPADHPCLAKVPGSPEERFLVLGAPPQRLSLYPFFCLCWILQQLLAAHMPAHPAIILLLTLATVCNLDGHVHLMTRTIWSGSLAIDSLSW